MGTVDFPTLRTGQVEQHRERVILGDFCVLPHELSLHIFSYLTKASDLCTLSLACKDLFPISRDDVLWKHLLKKHFPASSIPPSNRSYFEHMRKEVATKQNFLSGIYQKHVLGCHAEKITCIDGNDIFFCIGSWDGTLAIWDIDKNTLIKTLNENCNEFPKEVVSVQFVNDCLYAFSTEGIIKAWNITSWLCVQTLDLRLQEGMESFINCTQMQIVGDLLYIGSMTASSDDPLICIYDLRKGKVIQTISQTAYYDRILSPQFQIYENYLFVGADCSNKITLYDAAGNKVDVFQDNQKCPWKINCFHVSNDVLYTCHENFMVGVWNLKSRIFGVWKPQRKLVDLMRDSIVFSNDPIQSITAIGDLLIFGSKKGCIEVWNPKEKKCLYRIVEFEDEISFYAHIAPNERKLLSKVSALRVAQGRIVGGFGNGDVKVWDFTPEAAQQSAPANDLTSNPETFEEKQSFEPLSPKGE